MTRLGWLQICAVFWLVVQANGAMGQPLTPRLFSTNELLNRLNSPRYEDRASATEELTRLGVESIRPLARKFPEATPEQAWRIRQILRRVAIEGDEETFFKAAATLRILVGDSGSNQIETLQNEWVAAKSEQASATLQSLGAEIILADESDPFGNNWIISNEIQQQTDSPIQSNPVLNKPLDLPPEELQKQVDSILLGTIDENRERALAIDGKERAESDATKAAAEVPQDSEVVVLRGQRILIVQGNRGFAGARNGTFYPEYSNRIKLGPHWKGDEAAFNLVSAVKGINSIELMGLNLSANQLRILARIDELQHVRFDRCEFEPDALLAIQPLSRLENLTLANMEINSEWADALEGFHRLTSLRIENLKYDPLEFWNCVRGATGLFQIEIKQQNLQTGEFAAIGQFRELRSLTLTWSKFPMSEYRQFLQDHPIVRPLVTNKAFLGVRGGSTFDDQDSGPCVITEVIPDSAAAKAGLEVQDLVEQINDQKVASFRELVLYISNFEPGDTVKLKIMREGKPLELSVVLAERPPNAQ